jgi:hypothetical protein
MQPTALVAAFHAGAVICRPVLVRASGAIPARRLMPQPLGRQGPTPSGQHLPVAKSVCTRVGRRHVVYCCSAAQGSPRCSGHRRSPSAAKRPTGVPEAERTVRLAERSDRRKSPKRSGVGRRLEWGVLPSAKRLGISGPRLRHLRLRRRCRRASSRFWAGQSRSTGSAFG